MGEGILHGEDLPGKWEHGSVSGGYITFRLPESLDAGPFHPDGPECVELVLDIGGDSNMEFCQRPVEIWAVAYRPDRIVMNYRDLGETIDSVVGIESAAERAAGWMEDNPGN
jgi:hypothetical protein